MFMPHLLAVWLTVIPIGVSSMVSALLADIGNGVPLMVGWLGLGASALLMASHRPIQ